MLCNSAFPAARAALLFTPGPLTTSLSVKQAMLHDAGSWHSDFNAVVANVREQLLALAGLCRSGGWEVILLQGSGTFGVEAVFQTCVPPEGRVMVLSIAAGYLAARQGQDKSDEIPLRRGGWGADAS